MAAPADCGEVAHYVELAPEDQADPRYPNKPKSLFVQWGQYELKYPLYVTEEDIRLVDEAQDVAGYTFADYIRLHPYELDVIWGYIDMAKDDAKNFENHGVFVPTSSPLSQPPPPTETASQMADRAAEVPEDDDPRLNDDYDEDEDLTM